MEIELRSCRESLERSITDKECLQRQTAAQIIELDRLRQEKEALEMHQRVMERETNELKERFASCNRSLTSTTGNIAQQEATICQLRGEVIRGENVKGDVFAL